MINITPRQLRKAADIQEKIQSLQEELGQLLGLLGSPVQPAAKQPPANGRRKRKISAAGIARIVAATKARWARIRAEKAGGAVQKRKRRMSAAGRARLAASARARWAKAKRAGKSRL
jgi:hypothetical protein